MNIKNKDLAKLTLVIDRHLNKNNKVEDNRTYKLLKWLGAGIPALGGIAGAVILYNSNFFETESKNLELQKSLLALEIKENKRLNDSFSLTNKVVTSINDSLNKSFKEILERNSNYENKIFKLTDSTNKYQRN